MMGGVREIGPEPFEAGHPAVLRRNAQDSCATLFSLRHHSRLDLIEAAFAALGKRLHVEVRNAAYEFCAIDSVNQLAP